MKFTIQKNILNDSLKHVTSVISNSSISPILSCVYISVNEEDVTLVCANENISIKAIIDKNIQISKSGKFLINARIVTSIVDKIDSSEIALEIVDNKVVRISSGNFVSDINLFDLESYPEFDFNLDNKEKCNISTRFFKEINSKVLKVTNPNKTSSTSPLGGVLIDASRNEGVIETIGTDTFHLVYIKKPYTGVRFKLVMNIESIKIINSLLDNDKEIEFYVASGSLLVKIGNYVLNCRLIEGVYPSAIRVIESTNSLYSFDINKKNLINALEKAFVISSFDERPTIQLTISKNSLRVNGQNIEKGNTYEEIAISSNVDESIIIILNVICLLNLIRNIDAEEVLFELSGSGKPVYVKENGNKNYVSLVLPSRF